MTDLTEMVRDNYFFCGWKREKEGVKARRAYECVRCDEYVTVDRVKHYVSVHFGLFEGILLEKKKRSVDYDKTYEGTD